MTIINNRDKIQSEISSKKYKDNWEEIWGKKSQESLDKAIDEIRKVTDDKVQFCDKCSSCSGADNVHNCSCLQADRKD